MEKTVAAIHRWDTIAPYPWGPIPRNGVLHCNVELAVTLVAIKLAVEPCRPPQSWRLLHREAGQWHDVARPSGCGVETDRFNTTTFDEVETDALRIEVQLRERFSGGILEWRVP